MGYSQCNRGFVGRFGDSVVGNLLVVGNRLIRFVGRDRMACEIEMSLGSRSTQLLGLGQMIGMVRVPIRSVDCHRCWFVLADYHVVAFLGLRCLVVLVLDHSSFD